MIHFEMRVRFGKEKSTALDDIVIYSSASVSEFCAPPNYLQSLEVVQYNLRKSSMKLGRV